MTIAVSQATTAAQMITSAVDPMIGTSCEFSTAPLRTTSNGTTPMAASPAARTTSGSVKSVMSPASTSGSLHLIEASSAVSTERARRKDIPHPPQGEYYELNDRTSARWAVQISVVEGRQPLCSQLIDCTQSGIARARVSPGCNELATKRPWWYPLARGSRRIWRRSPLCQH